VVDYLPDHYGAMQDGVNRGDETDRFELVWDLGSDRAVQAGRNRLGWIPAGGRPLAVGTGPDGRPSAAAVSGVPRLVQLPPDIEGLRRADPAGGLAWRRAVRDAMLPALQAGAVVSGLTADGHMVIDLAG
jgi:predicted GNAT superfamily acetyltransferase